MGNDNDHKVPKELRARPRTLSYISVYTPPIKTTYFEGELFDAAGMAIKAPWIVGSMYENCLSSNSSYFRHNRFDFRRRLG